MYFFCLLFKDSYLLWELLGLWLSATDRKSESIGKQTNTSLVLVFGDSNQNTVLPALSFQTIFFLHFLFF